MDERQLDLSTVIEQYQQILSSLAARETVTLATMIEGVSMVTRMLKVRRDATELQAVLAKNGMIETLLDVMQESRLDTDLQKMPLPVIIARISLLLRDCEAACLRADTNMTSTKMRNFITCHNNATYQNCSLL